MLISTYMLSMALLANTKKAAALTIENCEFGEAMAFGAAKCDIGFFNGGDKPIRVSDIQALNEGVSIKAGAVEVPANGKAYLEATLNVGNSVGKVSYGLRLRSSEAGHEQRSSRANGFVLTVLDESKPEVDLGIVDRMSSGTNEKEIVLSSRELSDFKITKIIEKPEWLDVKINASAKGLLLSAGPKAALGLHDDYVKVAINSARQAQAWILVKANVRGQVIPSANPYDMGLMRYGNKNEYLIRLTERAGNDFEIGKVALDGVKGKADAVSCEPVAKGCRMIRLRVSDEQPSGTIKGKVWVDIPALGERLPINLWGLIVAKDFKIGTLGPESATNEGGTASPQSAASGSMNLQDALKGSIKSANSETEPSPPGSGPLLKWTISNGSQIYGFQIFRSDAREGPFTLINSKVIPTKDASNDVTFYQWRDNSASSGRSYWYYIGVVRADGSKQQLSGAAEVKVK